MAIYYCNCTDDKKKMDSGRSSFKRVETDDDGICKECGYYAVGLSREPRDKTDLYYMIAGYKDGDKRRTESNKQNRERRWEREAERESETSDLDI